MKIINCTPHVVNNILDDQIFPPSGIVARCQAIRSKIIETNCLVTLFKTTFGPVENLPDETEDTLIIVSALVRSALPNRHDLISPGEAVRNENGVIIGCKGFDKNA